MTHEQKTEVDVLQADPKASGNLAAARLADLVAALMEAVEDACPARQKDIAEAMGVTPGRVSQLMAGDGNVRIATLARFLDGCGYELSLTATPKSGEGLPITLPRPPRSGRRPARVDTAARGDVSTADAPLDFQAPGLPAETQTVLVAGSGKSWTFLYGSGAVGGYRVANWFSLADGRHAELSEGALTMSCEVHSSDNQRTDWTSAP